ncbi:MAG: hypothetical protein JNJ49_08540 [Bdellovibrionaceae bacterium]|nr:hypothetical protein [Pseudobdellovibrionaceae bacterium]
MTNRVGLSSEISHNEMDAILADDGNFQDMWEWEHPHPELSFCVEEQIVRFKGIEIRVRERTVRALKALTKNLRFQRDAKILPTKAELIFACGASCERNEREFKVGKELFPYPELRKLIRYDRRRKGYYLCLA